MIIKESIVIEKPIELVFEQWADLEKYSEWADPVIERKKITEGPVNVGTQFHAIDQWPGKKAEFDMEITEFEKDHKLSAKWFKPMEGAWSSTVTETPEGTRLDFEIHMTMSFFMRIMSFFLKGWIKSQNRKFMVDFKKRVEAL